MVQGTVKWFKDDKGFGFIRGDDGQDVFVHYSAINGRGRRTLNEGQRVAYEVTTNDRGLAAQDVTVLNVA